MKYTFDSLSAIAASEKPFTLYAVAGRDGSRNSASYSPVKGLPVDSLLTIDVFSGRVTARPVLAPCAHTAPAAFAEAVRGQWYYREASKIDEHAAAIAALDEDAIRALAAEAGHVAEAEDAIRGAELLKGRIAAARVLYEGVAKRAESLTVRAVVAALRGEGAPAELVELSDKLSEAVQACKAPEEGDVITGLASVRAAADSLFTVMWTASEAEGVGEYICRCNATIAADIYRRGYAGRRLDSKTGKVVRALADKAAIFREAVFARLERLQALAASEAAKNAPAAVEASDPAEALRESVLSLVNGAPAAIANDVMDAIFK